MAAEEQPVEVQRFVEFLRIETVSHTGPEGSYQRAVAFLRGLLEPAGLRCRELELSPGRPVLLATLEGTEPALPSVVLNSHYDVVPADRSKWSVDPFAAEIRDGAVYARGAQDMKCVCMQYVEALLRLARAGRPLRRTVHATFVPDEEIGGALGMGLLVEHDEFRALNAGVALDEGLACPEPDRFTVFYAERAVWWLKIRAEGPTGHASRFIEGAATDRLMACVNKFLAFREEQRQRLLKHGPGCEHAVAAKLGDVATVNLTALRAGVSSDGGKSWALNVVPTEAEAGFDIRVPPSMPLEEVEGKVRAWTEEFGLTYEFVYKTPAHGVSPTEGPFFRRLEETLRSRGKELNLEVFPAGTDGRYMRALDIPVYGFSPMDSTPILLHDHDERLDLGVFLAGIDTFEQLVADLASVPPPPPSE